jgi:maltose/moltooligosaccharide transporter
MGEEAPVTSKPILSLFRIIEMNIGFLGLQFSFGLQQANMNPIYSFLGADEAHLPFLGLAGPITGLLIQPLVGAMSDRTLSRFGRRTPYFLVGAVFCSLGLLAMPYSPALWVAASLLWVLDAANNITMEPYRAYVSDRLDPGQRELGFLTQSAFTGIAQTLAYATPSILVCLGMSKDAVDAHHIPIITKVAFGIGAVMSISTILWSVFRVRELPLSAEEIAEIQASKARAPLQEIWRAIIEMPVVMRDMALMSLFQWYGMACYWGYITYSLSRSVFGATDAASAGYRSAVLLNGQVGAFYNAIAFAAAFALVPFSRRLGAKTMHMVCLAASGLGMLFIPHIHDQWLLFAPMIGVGLGWASIMGNPYVMLSNGIPPERTGVYMGIFNMFIVIPMLLIAATLPFYYRPLLGGDARNVISLAGLLMIAAAMATSRIRVAKPASA